MRHPHPDPHSRKRKRPGRSRRESSCAALHSRQIRDRGDIRDSFVIATVLRKDTRDHRRCVRDIRDAVRDTNSLIFNSCRGCPACRALSVVCLTQPSGPAFHKPHTTAGRAWGDESAAVQFSIAGTSSRSISFATKMARRQRSTVQTMGVLPTEKCAAEQAAANASCNCGKPYVPKAQRVGEAIEADPDKPNKQIARETGAFPSKLGESVQN